MITEEHLKTFEKDGYVILDSYFTNEEVDELRHACDKLVDELNPEEHKCIFTTTDAPHISDVYFLESGDKIRFFFEAEAVDEKGHLKVDKHRALNKIGHALHWLDPSFKKLTFSDKVKDICRKLNFKDPALAQSMYIFKQPSIGGEVRPHQDGSFLYTEPMKVIGLWIALEDVTLENGCLQFIPGSQHKPISLRFIRNPQKNTPNHLIYTGPSEAFDDRDFVPALCKKGSCIVIHGQVVHKSEHNRSPHSRHIYTFHVIEQEDSKYSEENWLQPTMNMPFPSVYEN